MISAALLKEVSEITGGNILTSDPNQANLFDKSGVKFPETHLPLTRQLMFIWLVLFLLDVAVRRIALDVRVAARRVVSFVRSLRAERKVDRTLERLRLTRQKLREQLSARSADAQASRRYEAKAEFKGDLPVAAAQRQPEPPREKEPAKAAPKKTEAAEQPSHIQQLLKAKRKAVDRRQDGETENDK